MKMKSSAKIFLQPPYIGRAERAAVMKAFDSGFIAPCGPQLDEFERRLAKLSGRKYAVALSSGTAAIDLILEYLGVDRTWTVVAPTLSFIATVSPAWHRGAKLVLVDSDSSGNMSVPLLAQALAALVRPSRTTSREPRITKILVIGVDLYGRCCDYAGIAKVCRRYGVKFFVDAAESVGSKYRGKGSGSGGFAAVYSFNGNKTVTTSGGGAIVTDSKRLADSVRKLAMQSREPVLHYEHKEVGYNHRMSNVLAAIGLAQLDRLPEILKKKRKIAAAYGIADDGSNHWLNVLYLKDEKTRDAVIRSLAREGIEARPVWKPMHLQPVFRGSRKVKVFGGNVAENLFRRGICLPSGAALPLPLVKIIFRSLEVGHPRPTIDE